ncbi:MFS transporter [Nocardioides anomalus]|uniref:MFS transporter n=1 Tax=Nocardioides anomalus TaxID=2712223 RepID=A0A6G6W8E9_9ACTN|nr:MFS transporter [Nocardioides anomalus]QIG41621.1 MFS transporter [Nocardioides anomalus]
MPNPSQTHTRLVTVVLTGAAFLAGLDLFIVNVAFGEIGRDLGVASLGRLSWVLTAYAVVYASLLVPMGRLTDRYGRKGGFVAGLALFTLASLACALSTGLWELVAFRALQAVGAAAMTPASLGLLLAALPPERRAPAARLWAMTGALAAAFGPAIGGGLVQLSWHWAFLINLPIGALLVVAAIRYVPDVRHNQDAPRPDLTGATVLALAIGSLVLALVQGDEWGWSSGRVLAAFAGAAVGLVVFAWSIIHHPAPVIDPALLKVASFSWANVATVVFNVGFGIALLSRILWMQQEWGYSAVRTGLAVASGPIVVPIVALLAARLFPRTPPGHLIAAGSVLFAASAVWQTLAISTTPAYWSSMFGPWVLGGVAVGLAMPNLVAAATSALPPAQAATGSGVVSTARQLGLVLGTSAMVGILGAGLPSVDRYQVLWLFLAACSLLAAAAAVAMELSRRPVVVAVPEAVQA